MRKNIDILHIYYGTSGSAGLYIDRIYKSLSDNFSQEVIVNYYYPFSYGKKIFYKYTELSSPYARFFPSTLIRHIVRFVELLYGLLFTFLFILKNKVSVLNYSLTSDLNIEYRFIKIVKRFTRTRVVITCHDVVPFSNSSKSLDKSIAKKSKFFKIADKLIVHNDNSISELVKFYNIDVRKTLEFSFPSMDLKLLNFDIKNTNTDIFKVGMVGHFRKEKGLEVLINAWKIFYSTDKNVELILAGNFPKDTDTIIDNLSNYNVTLIKKFISDKEYAQIISDCDVIVLPYLRGTNSGIPSSVVYIDTIALVSDIDMFKNNKLISKDFIFETGSSSSLSDKLQYIFSGIKANKHIWLDRNKELIKQYESSFDIEINKAFESIIR